MAAIGLAEASRLTGKNQSTIHRAMAKGRLSYTRDEAGECRIDVAELERVFGTKVPATGQFVDGNSASSGTVALIDACHDTHGADSPLHTERELALQGLLDERERIIARQDEVIRDLRAQRDRDAEEKRTLITLLVDRRPWWRRWFR